MDGGGRAMQDDSMDGIGRVASGTKTEQLPRTKSGARVENRSVYVNHEDYAGLRARQSLFKIAPCDFVEHGTYSQDVLYADFAGAKIGDAAIAEKVHF